MNDEQKLELFDSHFRTFGELILSRENAEFYTANRSTLAKPIEASPRPLYQIEPRNG